MLSHEDRLHFLDRQMESKATVHIPANGIAVAHDFIVATQGSRITRYSYSGEELATASPDDNVVCCPVLSSCGLLFCVCSDGDDSHDEIIAFDSHSLQEQRRFGRGLLHFACGLAICGGELYVCDCYHDCIQVFSFTGELLRAIRGEWLRPKCLLCVRDRLYVTELYDEVWDAYEDERPEGYSPEMARRVFVISPAGEALETYGLELEAGQRILRNVMAAFGENLVLGLQTKLVALRGL